MSAPEDTALGTLRLWLLDPARPAAGSSTSRKLSQLPWRARG